MCFKRRCGCRPLCLLQDREEGTADPTALAFPEHLPSAPCFQKTVDGLCPSLPKKLVQLKKFYQDKLRNDESSQGAADVHCESGRS